MMSCCISIALPAEAECSAIELPEHDAFPTPSIKANIDRLYFLASKSPKTPHCPSLNKNCQLSQFLVAGNELLITNYTKENFVCAHYISPSGKISSGLARRLGINIHWARSNAI